MPRLYLSNWEDEDVFVSSQHVDSLKSYHVTAVRSLYETYHRQFKGKLISYPDGINISVVLRAFLSVILNRFELPALVLCEEENLSMWNFELSKLTNVKIINFEHNFDIENCSAVICSLSKLKDLPKDYGNKWSVIVTENIETVVNKMMFKNIGDARFKVGLTKKDFMDPKESKVFWHILHWCNPGLFGKLIQFAEFHQEHYDNIRDPYDDVWHRIDWDLPDDYLIELETENKEYNKLVREWAQMNEIVVQPSSSTTNSRSGVKRKLDNNKSTNMQRKTKSFNYTPKSTTHIKKVKSSNDIDSVNLMKEDSWIEDYMRNMEIPSVINKEHLTQENIDFVEDNCNTKESGNGVNHSQMKKNTPF